LRVAITFSHRSTGEITDDSKQHKAEQNYTLIIIIQYWRVLDYQTQAVTM